MARKVRFRVNPNRIPDDSSGFTPDAPRDVSLAESSLLSIPQGSMVTVDQMLSDFPLRYVAGQALANFRSAGSQR